MVKKTKWYLPTWDAKIGLAFYAFAILIQFALIGLGIID